MTYTIIPPQSNLIPPNTLPQHAARRAALMQTMRQLTGGGIAVIYTAPEIVRNADSYYPYRYDSGFYYLTGFAEPEAVLILDATQSKSILFCRQKDTEREIWDGYRWGVEAAQSAFGFDETAAIDELAEQLPQLLANQPAVYFQLGTAVPNAAMAKACQTLQTQTRQGKALPTQWRDIQALIGEQRLIKDASELAILQKAANISAKAHVRAMRHCQVGLAEYHLEAELLHEFRQAGAQFPAYTSIVATGANTCVLHYRADNAVLKTGDMVLIDAGCELDGYASDITRTFPANGKFTGEQAAVYELVLAAQTESLKYLSPQYTFNDYNEAATKVLAQGLLDFGWLQGSLESVLASGSYRQFYMHRAGHWLGMDVHDCGQYRVPNTTGDNRPWRHLEAGMVLTVEPGLYIRPAHNVPESFWNIGVRIEDDAVITATGHTLTTRLAPVTISEIEAVMRE